jgi:imidazolonepropionase-like amidohydrolase
MREGHMTRMLKATTLFLTILMLARPARAQQAASRTSLFLDRVAIVDVIGGRATPDMAVVIRGNRITEIGERGKVAIPDGAHVVNAAGKFLIPGLWDMHVHGTPVLAPYYYVVNGVTGVRDMGGRRRVSVLRNLVAQMSEGRLVAPRIVAAGEILEGPVMLTPVGTALTTAQQGKDAVAAQKSGGVDFVKVYGSLPRDIYFAIVDEAKRQGLPFAGHVPYSVTAAEASNAGQKSIEHLVHVLEGCSTREEEFKRQANTNAPKQRREFLLGFANALDTYDVKRAAALFKLLATNGTFVTPTISVRVHRDEDYTKDPRVKYLVPELRQRWDPRVFTEEQKAAERDVLARLVQHYSQMIPAMLRAGVRFLAGTDAGASPAVWPGFSLHEELELLVKGGMTPIEALRAATINATLFLGTDTDLGSIETGKLADLVLLDANPLVDIRNTTKINAVVLDGRLLDRTSLDRHLADIGAAAKK